MLAFSSNKDFQQLLTLLKEVDPKILNEVEEEYVFLYPHVIQRLEKAGVRPKVAYTPNKIPNELV